MALFVNISKLDYFGENKTTKTFPFNSHFKTSKYVVLKEIARDVKIVKNIGILDTGEAFFSFRTQNYC